jgi:hypothetical protein
MRHSSLTAILILATTLLAPASGLPADAQSASDYDRLLPKAQGSQGDIDFLQLRYAYAASPHYQPYGPPPEARSAMFDAFKTGDYAKASALAESVLVEVYVDIRAHKIAELSYRHLADEDRATLHNRWAVGLLRSILSSGDGKSPETAYVVISVEEEYDLMSALGLKLKQQALVHQGDHDYDRMEVSANGKDRPQVLFFNIDRPIGRLHQSSPQKP